VLGIYGEQDGNIPVDRVRAFEQALKARNVENTITVYPGVGHAFVKSDTYRNGAAAEQAWRQMVQFLNRNIKG
jgi:dienelactone hydrolase